MALAKAIIAVAWADHVLDEEEIESLKDVVFHLNSTFDRGSQLGSRMGPVEYVHGISGR